MRLLIGVAVGALATLTVPQQHSKEPAPMGEQLLFSGLLTQLDGVAIEHTQIKIQLLGGALKPRTYRLTAGCEDRGGEFPQPTPPSSIPEEGRWRSEYSPEIWSSDMVKSGILAPEYRCPTTDPALFARVTAILNARSTLDYQPEDHVEFQSSAGVARFRFTHPVQID